MKPSIIYLTTLLAVAGVASAGDSKVLLQKALFAEEVEQNSAKAAELYQRMIDQAESAPKQLAVARFRLAKLHLAAGKHVEALAQLQALTNDPAAPADWVAQAKTLLADGRVTIKSSGGMTLEVATSTITYQKDTTIDAPRFTLTAAGELKIIYANQADLARHKPVPAPHQEAPGIASLWLPAGGSDLERINATGKVVFRQKPLPGITPFEASGAAATYEPATGRITLSGGSPWIRRDGIITRAKQPNQTITINANTITFSPGGTETRVSIPNAGNSGATTDQGVFERLKDKVWNWHSGDNLYDEPNRIVRFLPDGKLENALEDGWLIKWAPVGTNRFQVTQREGKYWIYELSEDGKEAFAVPTPGGEDNRKRLCVHPTAGISIEEAEIETLNRLLKAEPDSIIERMIPFDLVKHNRIKALSCLFDHGTPVDLREKGGFQWTLLMFAASFAELSTVEFLLDRGADVNALDNRNTAPLFIAVWRGDTKIASLLLDRDANLENQSSCIRGDNGLDLGTALHGAAQWGRLDAMKLLLDRGADINALSPVKHNTPLICALAVKAFKEANELINRGADPNLPLSGIANPLRLMASQGNKEMVRELLAHGARIDIQSEALFESHGISRTVGAVLPVAAREGRFEVIQILVDAGCPVDQTTRQYLETPLHAAALSGNTATCKWLLEKGANLNHRLAEDIGLQSGWTPLHSAVCGESIDVMTLLLSKGASPTEVCGDAGLRRTAFQLAVLKGWLPVVKSLLAQPAYQMPEARKQLLAQPDLQGNTALHLAVSREAKASAEMVKLLIASGAPHDVVNERHQTPRQLATDPVQGTRDEAVRNALKD